MPNDALVDHEPGTQIPTRLSKEAWESAFIIAEEVENLLAEHGFKISEGQSKTTTSIARLVQLAINRTLDVHFKTKTVANKEEIL